RDGHCAAGAQAQPPEPAHEPARGTRLCPTRGVSVQYVTQGRSPPAAMETTMPSYDSNNIFTKILRGELPSHKVYEAARALPFPGIMARAPGPSPVLPKASPRNILDGKPDDLAHVMAVAQKIAKAAMKAFAADGVTIQQFNEPAGGQVVFHLHVHVIPRRDGVQLKPPASHKEEPAVLADNARKLAAALAGA